MGKRNSNKMGGMAAGVLQRSLQEGDVINRHQPFKEEHKKDFRSKTASVTRVMNNSFDDAFKKADGTRYTTTGPT